MTTPAGSPGCWVSFWLLLVTHCSFSGQAARHAWASVLPFCETGRGAGSLSAVRSGESVLEWYGLNCVGPSLPSPLPPFHMFKS